MAPPIPPDETMRLAALQRSGILDTPPDPSFDRITCMVARIFQVPVSLVTLVDEHRQWFKSCYGLTVKETDREVSFCSHAILQDTVMVVPNALDDPRFATNPLVTGDPNIRFYAGAPLRTADGFKLGTLCIIDLTPRTISKEEQATLADLAALVTDEIELRMESKRAHEAEEALRVSESRYRTIVEHAPIGISSTDAEGNLLQTNRAHQAMFGYSEEEIRAVPMSSITHPEDIAESRQFCNEIFRGKRDHFQVDKRYYRKDGQMMWTTLTVSAVRDEQGSIRSLISMLEDITARKQAENELRTSEERYRKLIDLSPDAIAVHSEDKIVYANAASAELLGASSPDELLGRSVLALVHPDYREIVLQRVAQMRATGQKVSVLEEKLIRLDGTVIDVEVAAMPLTYRDKPALQVVVRDITARKRARRQIEDLAVQLAFNAGQLNAIVDAMPDGVYVFNPDGGLIRMNTRGSELLRLLAGKTQPLSPDMYASTFGKWICHADGRTIPDEEHPVRRALRGEIVTNYHVMVRGDEPVQARYLRVSAAPIREQPGMITGTVMIASDITDLYRLERQKDEFLVAASHELKTPITAIKGLVQNTILRLSRKGNIDEAARLQRVDIQINRLTQIVRDLLDISRIQAGRLEMNFKQLDLSELVQQACEAMQLTTPKHAIRFSNEAATPLIVNGDPERLEQVFTNLLSNAIKYSPAGGVIEVVARRTGSEALIGVRDFGLGIPAEDRAQLFSRFHRAGNITKHRITGFGIGLYISREVVQAHAGRIWLDDSATRPDETLDPGACGSLFCVALPLV